MPVVSKLQQAPAKLRPFLFHGVDIEPRQGYVEAIGQCPFCDKRKLYVNTETGQWSCKTCGCHGNVPSFLKQLYDASDRASGTDTVDEFMRHRGYLLPETVVEWGIVKSALSGEWLIPNYALPNKNLVQLNRYVPVHKAGQGTRWQVYVTPDTPMQPYGLHLWDDSKPYVYVCEGPWDAMALWEVLRSAKMADEDTGGLLYTSAPGSSLLANGNVVGVPSCSVFPQQWAPYFRGKHVVLLYDNDYPRKHPTTGQQIGLEGYAGMQRVTKLLSSCPEAPASISMVYWGEEGYDLNLPDGCDVRDFLQGDRETTSDDPAMHAMTERVQRLQKLLDRVKLVPSEWLGGQVLGTSGQSMHLEATPCTEWKKLIHGWRRAMKWTEGLDRALSVMLACIASTKAGGDQLWAKIIGPAGCGKSTLCEALSANKSYILAKSTIRGFHSGFKTDKNGTDDHSLVAQVQGKTLITKDGDTLLQSPNLKQILAEARDLYDRTSRTHYRHGLNRDYEGVSMTWLLCGTSSLRELDSSELGERFLDCVIMDEIDDVLEDDVLRRVFGKAVSAAGIEVNGRPDSQHAPEMTDVMKLTSGYIDYLRMNGVGMAEKVEWPDAMRDRVLALGKFVSYVRARPSLKQDETAEREFAARLVSQFARLAIYLSVVLNKTAVDEEVIRRVRRTALDTARGTTLEILREIVKHGPEGIDTKRLAFATNQTDQKTRDLCRFLRQIKAVEQFRQSVTSGLTSLPKWRLTDRMMNLYEEVMREVWTPK